MDKAELNEQIKAKSIRDADLSGLDLDGLDLSGCRLENVILAHEDQQGRVIRKIDFKGARLEKVFFDGARVEGCDFDGEDTILKQVSFARCEISKCRFRKPSIRWSDFRYTEIADCTFESSVIEFCDFYRSMMVGVDIFRKSKIGNCSLYYAYFDEGATLRRDNLVKGRLLQENRSAYLRFLNDWHEFGTGVRKNDQKKVSDWSKEDSFRDRYAHAEDIYKTLNGLWMSKGYLADANWAYVRGKKMERKRMIRELGSKKTALGHKLELLPRIAWNFIKDIMFGYGESMSRMVLSYVVIIFLFAWFYYSSPRVSLMNYLDALRISFHNMIAMSPEEVSNVSPFIDFLNVVQTTIGILITGIFGFILGNKIRNQ